MCHRGTTVRLNNHPSHNIEVICHITFTLDPIPSNHGQMCTMKPTCSILISFARFMYFITE